MKTRAPKPLPDWLMSYIRENILHEPTTGDLRWRSTGKGRSSDGTVGTTRSDGYKSAGFSNRNGGTRRVLCHHIGWLLHYGEWPDCEIDHIDRNTSNNAIENLRRVSSQQNATNNSLRSDNTNGMVGIAYDKRVGRTKPWTAYITINSRLRCLGVFRTAEEAVAVRAEAEAHRVVLYEKQRDEEALSKAGRWAVIARPDAPNAR